MSFELHIKRSQRNLELLEDYVGKPGKPDMPQTTNQAIILILKDIQLAIVRLEERMQLLHEGNS